VTDQNHNRTAQEAVGGRTADGVAPPSVTLDADAARLKSGVLGRRPRLSPVWARAFFWVCSLAIPLSSVLSIAVLSHVLGKGQLAVIAAIFGVSFVGSVLPIGIQARTAADAASFGSAAAIRWRPIYVGTVIWVVSSPLLAYVLHVPLLAMLSPAIGLIPSMAVGVGRGELIGQNRFVAAGANHLVEASIRLVGGIGLGVWLGVNGAALSLILCQLGAWALLPRRHQIAAGFIRLPSVFATTALVILSVQLDLLLAPRLLGSDASAYAASALPTKSVYLALAATAWLVIPGAARCTRLRQALRPIMAVVVAGVVISVLLAVAAPVIGVVLGQTDPVPSIVLALGLAMALASGNWILVQVRVAKAPELLWLAPAVAVVVATVISVATRTEAGFCVGNVAGQALAMAVGLVQLHRGLRNPVEIVVDPVDLAPPIEGVPQLPLPETP